VTGSRISDLAAELGASFEELWQTVTDLILTHGRDAVVVDEPEPPEVEQPTGGIYPDHLLHAAAADRVRSLHGTAETVGGSG
jgi:hypothetical protein